MRRTYELWWATRSCKYGGYSGRSECWWGKNAGNGTFAALYCAIFRIPSYPKSLKFFGTSTASGSIDSPPTGIRHTICHVYIACGP